MRAGGVAGGPCKGCRSISCRAWWPGHGARIPTGAGSRKSPL